MQYIKEPNSKALCKLRSAYFLVEKTADMWLKKLLKYN